MKRTILLAALVLGFATYLFARPFSVPCPIDGEKMYWSGNQNGDSCEFTHDAWVKDSGELTAHKVKHTTWVSCSKN